MSLDGTTPSTVLAKIDSFNDRIEELSELSYEEGGKEERKLNNKIEKFIRVAFSDGNERVEDYGQARIEIIGREKTLEEKQEKYESRLEPSCSVITKSKY